MKVCFWKACRIGGLQCWRTQMNYASKILRNCITSLLFVVMFVTALLVIAVGVVVGGFFEVAKVVSHPLAKYDRAAPVVGVHR
jgi:TM2 domain-containing membrane protein YozV